MRITGKTRIMFILADAVDHIVGSHVLNEAFAAMELDVAVSPLSVAPEDLPRSLEMIRSLRNVAGFGVTIPHKMSVVPLVNHLTDAARAIGAVNFVRREADGSLTGHNIDGEGFLAGLAVHGVTPVGARVLQAGAGGVGRAIAFALADAGVASIHLLNRDETKARDLVEAVARQAPQIEIAAVADRDALQNTRFDLIINATSVGMHADDPLPLPPTWIGSGSVVAEVIMKPAITSLLHEAERRGARVVPGLAMMQPQPRLVARFLGLT
ncbi:shikimate dehydrogenase family protein [Tianweitania sediminis]|uniref:shikimate dehydrogenase (NADP(+)) n=1 Tax=Tianweitania sediminis TaxID=1502156 RepID=A0A8J7R4N9_9HYPH|nr:shikimate dehydrogenase [Tianweitania sediminis]MBP0440731.1 shikimate dehydrogenase [Tianweitania sediminis]